MEIYREKNKESKFHIAMEVLKELPEWFGQAAAVSDYANTCQELPLWVAKNHSGVVGFISLKETSESAAEIYCMGVKREYHKLGIGKKLFHQLEEYAYSKYDLLQVKTVAKGFYKEYDGTVAFYKRLGFMELEVFPTLWDQANPCLILVKPLDLKKEK